MNFFLKLGRVDFMRKMVLLRFALECVTPMTLGLIDQLETNGLAVNMFSSDLIVGMFSKNVFYVFCNSIQSTFNLIVSWIEVQVNRVYRVGGVG